MPLPLLPILGLGLKLLPQIPALATSVAGMFGKKVPDSVTGMAKLAADVTGMVESGNMPPEQKMELEARIMEHQETILKIQNDQEQMRLADDQHKRDTQVALWANEANSTDLEVKRTRPKILREMWRTCQWFIGAAVVVYGAATFLPIETSTQVVEDGVAVTKTVVTARDMSMFLPLIQYLGGFLFGTFSAGFLGYTVARTVDKKNPDAIASEGVAGKLMRTFLGSK